MGVLESVMGYDHQQCNSIASDYWGGSQIEGGEEELNLGLGAAEGC